MTPRILVLGMALLLGSLAPAQAQDTQAQEAQQAAPAQAGPRTRISTRTDLVVVPVTVKDAQGRLVGDLTKDEFRVLADGVEQQIALFDSSAFPLSAVVLIDNDLPQKAAAQVQKSLRAIAAGFGPNDEAALVTYDEFPTTISDFSSNNDRLFTQLKRLELGSHTTSVLADPTTAGPVINGQPQPTGTGVPVHGASRYKETSALDDAVYAAGEMLKGRGRDRRKIIFLISDGSNSRNQHSFEETLHLLLGADVSVYSISVSRSIPGHSLLHHGEEDLGKYAARTGGDTYFASKQSGLERLYSGVTEEARNQYTLAFSPQDLHKGEDYHPIEVRVRRPGLTILTREGYYQSALNGVR